MIPEFIPSENLILKEVLGEGEFGSVYRAIYQNREGFEVSINISKNVILETSIFILCLLKDDLSSIEFHQFLIFN